MVLTSLPLSQTVTLSRTPCPLERDVLYGRSLDGNMTLKTILMMRTVTSLMIGLMMT